ncbi:MAG: ATP-binding protein, partial [Spirochaetaceae bacterium]|nr:ATP-binding protein [Spirochaetaceae bacterium]
ERGSAVGFFGYFSGVGDLVVPSLIGRSEDGRESPLPSIVIPLASSEDGTWSKLRSAKKARAYEGPLQVPGAQVRIDRLLCAPIVFGDQTIGLLAVADDERPYTEDDSKELDEIARYVSPILNARLQGDRHERERMRAENELRQLNVELEARVRDRTVELERKNAQLQELDRLKSLFIASMSHELRTPLNSIIGFSSILEDGWAGLINPEQKKNLSIIQRSGKLLLSLINNVIDVSEMEAGAIEAHYSEFDVREVLEECASYIEEEARKKGLALRLDIHPRLLFTDRRRLLQCVLNLVSNAAKFSEKGEILLSTSESPSPGSPYPTIEISVVDTGYGIAESEMTRLFKPFSRLDSSIKAKSSGAGLGLYLTKRLAIEILRGDIRCESAVGTGSTFTLKVPERIDEEGPGSRRQRG